MITYYYYIIKQLLKIILLSAIFICLPSFASVSNTVLPSINGNPYVGSTLTASPGEWTSSDNSSLSYSYRWQSCDASGTTCNILIVGAIGSTYTVQEAALGRPLKVTVFANSATAGGGSADTLLTPIVTLAPQVQNVTLPSISGNPYVGSTLEADPGEWTSSDNNPISYTYRWQSCDASGTTCNILIVGAIGSTYTVQEAALGRPLKVTVFAHSATAAGVADSLLTPIVTVAPQPPQNITPPYITSASGSYNVGSVLTFNAGTWSGTPNTYSFQRLTCDQNGANCIAVGSPIQSINNSINYSIGSIDVSTTIRVQVSANNEAGTSTPITSSQTPLVTSHYDFNGFLSPISNPPTYNVMKAGSSAPLKFSLGGDKGLNVITSSTSQRVNCTAGSSDDLPIDTVNAGNSSLSYDPLTDQYTYVWKSEKSWKNTCRELIVTLTDGSQHRAFFQYK